jgi:signal transduction histidine kinase
MRHVFSKYSKSFSGERSLKEMKNLEWIFIAIHCLGVPAAIAIGMLHTPASVITLLVLAGLLAMWSLIAAFLNRRITTVNAQLRLGSVTQAVVSAFAWALIMQFVSGRETAAYAGFAIVIIEGAIRFGLVGSLIMEVVAALGLAIAMQYREWQYDLAFSIPGYIFWTVLLFFIALSVGLVTEETRRERRRSAKLVRERTLLEERHRIARDLHDTVLKTLHGLALQAHALKRRLDSPEALGKAEYIQNVCQRSSQEIRDIIDELRSEAEAEGIASQISRIVEDWGKATGIKTGFNVSGDDRGLPLLASYNLRSILSEALDNTRKHASASHVSVSVELLPGEMRLEIADNGKGIGYSGDQVYGVTTRGKYGIIGMKERVEQLNGQFSIDSSHGTRLLITVPLVPTK